MLKNEIELSVCQHCDKTYGHYMKSRNGNVSHFVVSEMKATLQLAFSGSLFEKFLSDEWGHDLDSDGNIFQDVNPDLFTAIINYLRLRALHIPIVSVVVYEDQKAAMGNLLAFYMMSDVPLTCIPVRGTK
eukprot:gene47511-biopygen36088